VLQARALPSTCLDHETLRRHVDHAACGKGKIDLDAPVVRYLPYFRMSDERYKIVTVRQMATHTSGIPDVDDYGSDKPKYDEGALERYVRSLSNLKLVFAPGEQFRYSNIAFEIMGDVIPIRRMV
jgi:CubicO group peptidase (beta-lactamase class C family)